MSVNSLSNDVRVLITPVFESIENSVSPVARKNFDPRLPEILDKRKKNSNYLMIMRKKKEKCKNSLINKPKILKKKKIKLEEKKKKLKINRVR